MMAMPSQEWYDELPEFITEEQYRALNEEISRTIEVVFGHVIKCESPTPRHNRIARRLANALESARPPADRARRVGTAARSRWGRGDRDRYAGLPGGRA
jgi:Uma2 family endonuclease